MTDLRFSIYYLLFTLIFLIKLKSSVKLLNTEKQLCRDLRNCQTYFPCRFLLMGNINLNLVERCSYDKVFDEDKQQCIKAEKLEDLECLLRLNSQFKSTPSTTTAKPTTKSFQHKTKKSQETFLPKHRSSSKSVKSKNELEAIFHALHLNPLGYYSDEDDEELESIKPPAKSKSSRKIESNQPKNEVTANKKDRRDHSENRINKLRKKSSDSDIIEEVSEYEEDEEYYYDESNEEINKNELENKQNERIIQVESKENLDNNTKAVSKLEESTNNEDDNQYKRMCVVTNWSQYRSGRGRFQYDFIEPYLCNYVIYTSVKVEEEEDPDYEDFVIRGIQHNEKELYAKLKILKSKNPTMKLILKITDDGGLVFSKLSKSFDTRANLVENVLEYINTNGFDGIEIDWRWPNGASGTTDDKINFISLLKDFRRSFDKNNKILGMIMSPLTDRIQSSYSLIDINKIVDYVNLEAFDYYGPWDKRTGLMAPLKKIDEQFLTEAYMNIDGTITYLKASGLSADKIVLGLAVHARTYALQVPHVNMINAPTKGNGLSGSFTKTNGFLSYYELCECEKKGSWKHEWHSVASAPYMHNKEGEWISYENQESLEKKIEFVKTNELAGVSIHSLDLDDFSGSFCNQGPYPFLKYTLSLLMKHPKTPQNVFLASSTKKTYISTSSIASTAKTTTIVSKPVNKKSQSQSNQFKDLKKKDNKIYTKQKSTDKQKTSTTTKKSTDLISTSPKMMTNSVSKSSSSPSYILITPPKLEGHETLKQWQERLSAKYTQELKNKMTARMNLGQATTTTIRNKHQKKQDQFLSQVHAHLPSATKKEPEKINQATQPVTNDKLIVISPIKSQFGKEQQTLNNQNIRLKNQEKVSSLLKQTDELLLKQKQDNELKRLEEQILRWQLDAKKWIMQLKTHQKHSESLSDVQTKQRRINDQLSNQYDIFSFKPAPGPLPTPSSAPKQNIAWNVVEINNFQQQNQKQNELPQPMAPAPQPLPKLTLPPLSQPKHDNIWHVENSFQPTIQQTAPKPTPPPPPLPPQPQPLPVDTRCNGKSNAIYRDEYDCSAFYICEVSTLGQIRIHTFKCPPGLIFNMDECTCDWPLPNRPCVVPLSVNFCKMTGPDESQRRHQLTSQNSDSQATNSNSYAVFQRIEPPLPPLPTWPSVFTCVNREKGLYRDPYDCSKFYYCQILTTAGLTIKHDFSCPHGLHFNLYNCQCDWPFNSHCNINGVSTLCAGF